MSNRAWVTLATNDSYSLGALVVAHSLRRSDSVYPAVVLITPSVTDAMRERLRAVFAEVVLVDVLDSKDAAHLALLQRPELGITFTKIHCWNLTQYEKCVFLDADTLIVQNCDELFEREELSAAPDVGWPDCFNSGVFVFRPSADTFSSLITFASERGSFDGGDQGLLNSYFSDWAQGDISKHLPFLYNVTSAAFYSYIPALKHYGQNLKIIHFIGSAKPWLQHFNWQTRSVDAPEHLREFLQLWWDLFVGQVHSQLDTTMGEVIADPLAILEEETVDYKEPTVNYSYYEPSLDSDSEFPWHHPENQPAALEINVPEIDMSEIHNPWDIYGGNIPAQEEDLNQNEKNEVDFQELRKYAWDYVQPHNNQYQTQNYEQTFYSNEHSVQHNNYNHHCEHKKDVWPSEYQSSPIDVNHLNVHLDTSHSDNYHQQIHHDHQHYEQKSQQDTQNHHHNAQQYHHDNTPTVHHSYYVQHVQENTYSEPEQTHEYHYNNFKAFEENNNTFNQAQNNESQDYNHVCQIHNYHEQEHQVSKKYNAFTSLLFQTQNRPQIYTVMMDHVKVNHRVPEEKMNGYASDDESDFEEITPRHPYDGFYLRHRMTIDSRGRKICTHEIPLRPPSPSSESSEEFEDAVENFTEEITNEAMNGENSQTGVAGNLARVVPGEPLQQEAVDELTRRQGWEAGNIDYMGADSFDNIWAKISQTLSQPPSSEQQEPANEKAPEAVTDLPGEPSPVEVAKEPEPVAPAPETATTAPTSESVPVQAPSQKASETSEESVEVSKKQEVEETPNKVVPVEDPKPVESVLIEKSSEAATPQEEVPAVVQSTPVEVPVPVEAPATATESVEVPGKPEEIIPVPVEAAAVELPASVESATEVKEKTEPESAEIPVVALEALKIGEPAIAHVAATKESAVPISESTTVTTEELKQIEAAKPDPVSDSPPLAHTPSKEEIPVAPAAKSEERRKPAEKLQLRPPLTPDPALTPDSEAEDAAALAHAIISAELRTPTVTAPTPPTLSPAVQQPSVSLSQIGVKSKPTTAARIESSVKSDSAPSTPESPKPAEVPKKKIIKKVVKKKEEGAASGEAPVPPPRKKEKKPKET